MYLQNKLLAKKQCYELAMQSALQKWQRDLVEFKCPACGSEKIRTRPGLRGKNPCWCPICKHYFDQPTHFTCDCHEPGGQSKCHDCPNFHKLLATVKLIAEDLQNHNSNQKQPVNDL
jgi:hypothetical protein